MACADTPRGVTYPKEGQVQIQGWLEDAWAPASSAASHEAPLWIAQAGGLLPVPARLMPAVFAAPLQGGPPGPPSRTGAETEVTPPAEAARLLEKAGTDEIPLIAGWNLISIPASRSLNAFTGRTWGGIRIPPRGQNITDRVLVVALENGAAAAQQLCWLDEFVQQRDCSALSV